MPDEASIPKNGEDTITGQAPQSADAAGQAPKSEDTSGQASEPEQFSSENLTGKPNTPTTPLSQENTTPEPLPLEDSVLPLRKGGEGGEETPAPEQSAEGGLTGKQAEVSESVPEPVPESQLQSVQANPPSSETLTPPLGKEESETTTPSQSPPSYHPQGSPSLERRDGGEARRGDLAVARAKIQETKRKKLDKIMALFERWENGSTSSPQVTNDEVEKLLRVSDATATRYLQILEKENKIKQTGKTGAAVFYEKI